MVVNMSEGIEMMSVGHEELRYLKYLSEKVFEKVFENREKAKQRVIYDLLNYLRSDDVYKFLDHILKLLGSYTHEDNIKKFIGLINKLDYYNPENFKKIGYTIIMGLMSSGGERNE